MAIKIDTNVVRTAATQIANTNQKSAMIFLLLSLQFQV